MPLLGRVFCTQIITVNWVVVQAVCKWNTIKTVLLCDDDKAERVTYEISILLTTNQNGCQISNIDLTCT